MTTTAWPKHADGSNKRVGDMEPEERKAVLAASKARVMSGHDWWGGVQPEEPREQPRDFWQPA